MAVPRTTLWEAPEHTKIKHVILREYLKAWYPTLGHGGYPTLIYLDGFAGPGEYRGGEPGSPIVALETLTSHSNPPRAHVDCIFIEANRARFDHLAAKLVGLSLPSRIQLHYYHSKFRDCTEELLKDRSSNLGKVPTFAFIDPFGFAGLPLELLSRIGKPSGSEVFITFMSEAVERWIFSTDKIIQGHMTEMFDSLDWKNVLEVSGPADRLRALHALYAKRLRERALFEYTRAFEMRDERGSPLYSLVFGTRSRRGVEKMKAAMRKADPGGTFSFSDATDPDQIVMLTGEPNLGILRRQLLDHFRGQTVSIEDVATYVDLGTSFLAASDLKQKTLVPLEKDELITVPKSPRKRPYYYPAGTFISFPR